MEEQWKYLVINQVNKKNLKYLLSFQYLNILSFTLWLDYDISKMLKCCQHIFNMLLRNVLSQKDNNWSFSTYFYFFTFLPSLSPSCEPHQRNRNERWAATFSISSLRICNKATRISTEVAIKTLSQKKQDHTIFHSTPGVQLM